MLEDRLCRWSDVVFSHFLIDDWLKEFRLPFHAVVFVCSGVVHVEYDDKQFSIRKGQSVFLRRDHMVKLFKTSADGEPYSAINVCLTEKSLRPYVREHEKAIRQVREKNRVGTAVLLPRIPQVDSIKEALLPYFADKSLRPSEDFLEEIAEQTIDSLVLLDERFCPTLFDFVLSWKINLRDFMEEHFTSDMSIKEFALYTGRSLATFKRDFAKFSNLTPERWLLIRRLEAAYALLEEGEQSVSDICWNVGFRNRSHFSTAFKRQYQKTPLEVQRKAALAPQ